MIDRLKEAINPKKIGSVLLIIGALMLLFPFAHNYLTRMPEEKPPEQPHIINNTESNAGSTSEPEVLEFLPKPGHLVIPAINVDLDVVYGISEEDLKKGPGFYPQSAHPAVGNVSIAGHRNAYGNPFMDLDKLKAGDQIVLTYDGKKYAYAVEKVVVVDEYDWSVIDPTPDPAITLTTCHPLYPVSGKYDRLIVRAKQTSSAGN